MLCVCWTESWCLKKCKSNDFHCTFERGFRSIFRWSQHRCELCLSGVSFRLRSFRNLTSLFFLTKAMDVIFISLVAVSFAWVAGSKPLNRTFTKFSLRIKALPSLVVTSIDNIVFPLILCTFKSRTLLMWKRGTAVVAGPEVETRTLFYFMLMLLTNNGKLMMLYARSMFISIELEARGKY